MPEGPGKYDEICTTARESAKAGGTILIVLNGEHGSGFSVQADEMTVALLPGLLRNIANQIEMDTQ